MSTRPYNFAKDFAKNQKLINDPIIISDKFLKELGIPSYESNNTFNFNLSEYKSKKNSHMLEAYSSKYLEQDLIKRQKYRDTETVSNKKTTLLDTTNTFTKENPFENSILKNHLENASSHIETGSIRPNTSNSFNQTIKMKEFSITIDKIPNSKESRYRKRYVNTIENPMIGFKVYTEKDKILRKAALKYFNNFETFQIKRDTKAKTDHLAFASDSGHIQLPTRPTNRYYTPVARRNSPLGVARTKIRFQNESITPSRKTSIVPPPLENSYFIDTPFQVKPTRITYVEDIERKYKFLDQNFMESSITEY